MMGLFVRGMRNASMWSERLLVWLAAPPIVLFAMVSIWSTQRVLFHWAAPGYLLLYPPLGRAIACNLNRFWVRRLLAGTAALVVVSLTVVVTQIQTDWLGNRLVSVLNKDPTAEGLDWTSLRDDLGKQGLLAPDVPVAVFDWATAGKIGYALGPQTTILCLSSDARQFAFAQPLSDFVGQDLLVLLPDPKERGLNQAHRWFRATQPLGEVSVHLQGRSLRTFTVLRGFGLLPSPRFEAGRKA
jgi:hypothetical protein